MTAEDIVFWVFLAFTAVFMAVIATITALKGRWVLFLLGFPTGFAWLVGALLKAKPGSRWSRWRVPRWLMR